MKYNPKIVTAYFKDCGLPEPEFEYHFHPTRKWRWDICWVSHKIAIEVQGGVWTRGKHGRGSGIVKDIEKHNQGVLLGWRILYVVPSELCMRETVDMVKGLIGNKLAGFMAIQNTPEAVDNG